MEIIIRRRDIYVVAVALSMFFSWVAYAKYDNSSARDDLRNLARAHVDEWFASEPEGTRREDYEYLAIVDMVRPYELFGPAYGVIHVYLRDKGDVDCRTFQGVEYYYRMENGAWVLEDSAGCGAKEHHVRAFQHYLADGMSVEDHVFDKAIGIDFDVAKAEAHLKARDAGENPFIASHRHDHGHDHGHGHAHGHDHARSHSDHGAKAGAADPSAGSFAGGERHDPPSSPIQRRNSGRYAGAVNGEVAE